MEQAELLWYRACMIQGYPEVKVVRNEKAIFLSGL
jgi:hypothetical protein